MELTLAIVTCGPQLEVALSGAGWAGPSVVRLAGSSRRSSLLLAAVDLLVEDSGAGREDIGVVAVSRGPGSFTGIRSGLSTVGGLAAAVGARIVAYDSLLVQAARVDGPNTVWAAQPGRRGEVYAQAFDIDTGGLPKARSAVEIVDLEACGRLRPWVASDGLDLGGAERITAGRTAAASLIRLADRGVESQPVEPLYVEGPPIHGGRRT